MAQAVRYICGFENGDGSEVVTLGSGNSVQSTTVRTGAYALQAVAAPCALNGTAFLAATQTVFRGYFLIPTVGVSRPTIVIERSTATARLEISITSGNVLQVLDSGVTLGLVTTSGTKVLVANRWYRLELAFDCAAGGVVQVRIDGDLDINTTHSNDVTAAPTNSYIVQGRPSPNFVYWDDIRIDSGGLAPIGAGQIIVRQGTAGTPNTNAWTKTGAATSALCWSDTPFATATNCSSSTSSASQSTLIAPFSTTQSGHGSQVVGANDTVNACKYALVGTAASSAQISLVRRVNGVQTLTAVALTTAAKYFDDGIWTTTPANLDLLDMGAQKAANTIQCIVYDVWVHVDYTYAPVAGSVAESGTAASTQSAAAKAFGTVTETGAAASTQSAAVKAFGVVAETGAAAATQSAAVKAFGTVAETGTASDHPSGQVATSRSVAEVGTAADSSSARPGLAATISEAGIAADTPLAVLGLKATIAEIGHAVDTVSSAQILNASLAESGSATDATSATAGPAAAKSILGGRYANRPPVYGLADVLLPQLRVAGEIRIGDPPHELRAALRIGGLKAVARSRHGVTASGRATLPGLRPDISALLVPVLAGGAKLGIDRSTVRAGGRHDNFSDAELAALAPWAMLILGD